MKMLQISILVLISLLTMYHVFSERDRKNGKQDVLKKQNKQNYTEKRSSKDNGVTFKSNRVRSGSQLKSGSVVNSFSSSRANENTATDGKRKEKNIQRELMILSMSWQAYKDSWESMLVEVTQTQDRVISVTNAGVCAARLIFLRGEKKAVFFDEIDEVELTKSSLVIKSRRGQDIVIPIENHIDAIYSQTKELKNFCRSNRELISYARRD